VALVRPKSSIFAMHATLNRRWRPRKELPVSDDGTREPALTAQIMAIGRRLRETYRVTGPIPERLKALLNHLRTLDSQRPTSSPRRARWPTDDNSSRPRVRT